MPNRVHGSATTHFHRRVFVFALPVQSVCILNLWQHSMFRPIPSKTVDLPPQAFLF